MNTNYKKAGERSNSDFVRLFLVFAGYVMSNGDHRLEQPVDENWNQEICPAHSCECETRQSTESPQGHLDFSIFFLRILDGEIKA